MNLIQKVPGTSIILLLVLASLSLIPNAFAQTYPFIATTRGSFNLDNGDMVHEIIIPSALSIINNNNICPGELAVYVHGVWATPEAAEEQSERVFLSLQKSGYAFPLIGFSWDSNTPFSLDDLDLSQHGWDVAKRIANENGPLLTKFIADFKSKCPEDKLRIIAHSLGSRVTLSAIQSLYDSGSNTNTITKDITSVHLLGAAVDDEQVSLNRNECSFISPPLRCSGEAIKSKVEYFYSLYNPEDNMLASEGYFVCSFFGCGNIDVSSPYEATEYGSPLGAYHIKGRISVPSNYHEYNVLPKIEADNDADKRHGCDLQVNLQGFFGGPPNYYCTILEKGDNHFGYMGYRSDINRQTVSNSGAIGSVVSDWKNENN